MYSCSFSPCLFFFNDPATTEIYTLSLHDALPICELDAGRCHPGQLRAPFGASRRERPSAEPAVVEADRHSHLSRSEEHTSELQSPYDLVCRLLLEKKK